MKKSEWNPIWSDYSFCLLDFIKFIKERYSLYDSSKSPFDPENDDERE
ncbi:MAG: hypothetical protein HQM08_12190 [Candidatus Riflebacteria bacterium]|nr:hypothetical protein [Candidatus Riflebacteria bacterium]